MRCEWCGLTVSDFIKQMKKKTGHENRCGFQTHSACRSSISEECGFGTLRDIIIPPYAISIPRIADLNKDLILGIGNNMSKPIQNVVSPSANNSANNNTTVLFDNNQNAGTEPKTTATERK